MQKLYKNMQTAYSTKQIIVHNTICNVLKKTHQNKLNRDLQSAKPSIENLVANMTVTGMPKDSLKCL